MDTVLFVMLAIIAGDAVLTGITNALNLRHLKPSLDPEFEGWYDAEKYRSSQEYLRVTTRFEQVQLLITTAASLAFIGLGGFGWADALARDWVSGLIPAGLVFTAIVSLLSFALSLPFHIYDTFVIEAKFGFNRTTVGTFIADRVKGLVLTAVLGGLILAGILWFFARLGETGWLVAWGALTVFQFIMLLLAPSLLLPIFNKFTPLADGELKQAVEAYAAQQQYRLSGIFTIDGSRRSTKANAYVTGLGRLKRIALFDTLIARHSVGELVAVLAHEVGHAKLGHIRKILAVNIATTGAMFYLLSLFISEPSIYRAIGVAWAEGAEAPIYAGLFAFGILTSPLNRILSILVNQRSRKHEYEADAFAVRTTGGRPEPMIDALKKLSVDNLSNLSPHPLMVWLEYSHPPVLHRIQALRRLAQDADNTTGPAISS